ncbi:hypothetical protein ES703_49889 [subsurface metagenome]
MGIESLLGESYFVNRISMLDTRYSSLVFSFVFCEHQVSRIEYPELKLLFLFDDSPVTETAIKYYTYNLKFYKR